MAKSSVTIRIKEPCRESWHKMDRASGGKFCHRCQEQVTDFTSLSDETLLELLSGKKNAPCGRFRKDQVDRLISSRPVQTRTTALSGLLAGILFFLSAETAVAQTTTEQYEVIDPAQLNKTDEAQEKSQTTNSTKKHISGRVTDSETGSEISGARVRIEGSEDFVTSDSNGIFSIAWPEEQDTKKVTLLVSRRGYKTQKLTVKRKHTKNLLLVKLNKRNQTVMGRIAYY